MVAVVVVVVVVVVVKPTAARADVMGGPLWSNSS